jgi:integrase
VALDYARKIGIQRMAQVLETGTVVNMKLERLFKITVEEMVEVIAEGMAEKGRAAAYIRDFKGQCRDYVNPKIGNMLVKDVERSDVDRLLMPLRSKRYLHNRVRSNLSRIFNEAMREGVRPNNPAAGAEKTAEAPRVRVLEDDEIDRLLDALTKYPGQEADAVRLLYLTGSRPKELLQSRWEDFRLVDVDKGASVWTKPAQTVKQAREHKVELSKVAAAVLMRMRDAAKYVDDGDYVFPSRKGAEKHMVSVKDYFHKVMKEAGINDARPYDLRKSFASRILNAGTDVKTAMSLTGHTQVGVFMKHYAQLLKGSQTTALNSVQWGKGDVKA